MLILCQSWPSRRHQKAELYETPFEIVESRDKLKDWVQKSIEIAARKW